MTIAIFLYFFSIYAETKYSLPHNLKVLKPLFGTPFTNQKIRVTGGYCQVAPLIPRNANVVLFICIACLK